MSEELTDQPQSHLVKESYEPETTDPLGVLRTLSENHFLSEQDNKDEFFGVVLASQNDPEPPPDIFTGFRILKKAVTGDDGKGVAYVRIEDIHAHLPSPLNNLVERGDSPTVLPSEPPIDYKIVTLHSKVTWEGSKQKFGNYVKVKFGDKKNFQAGEIIETLDGTAFDSDDLFPPNQNPKIDSIAPSNLTGSALKEFKECKKDPNCGWFKSEPYPDYRNSLIQIKTITVNDEPLLGSAPTFQGTNVSVRPEMEQPLKKLLRFAHVHHHGDGDFSNVQLHVNSGFRSYKQQRRLKKECGPHNPTCTMAGKAGTSLHQSGFALDISLVPNKTGLNDRATMKKFLDAAAQDAGLERISGDDPHIQYRGVTKELVAEYSTNPKKKNGNGK